MSTAAPTLESKPFTILYSVSDVAGNEAAMIARQVHVVCPAGEQLCPPLDGEEFSEGEKLVCSFDPKVCKFAQQVGGGDDEAADAALAESILPLRRFVMQADENKDPRVAPESPPTIKLAGPSEVTIMAGDAYALRCPVSTPPGVVCERGAVAHDELEGDLTHAVEVRHRHCCCG